MALKRMTKDEVPRSFGAFKPVGHVVVAFDDDATAARAADELRAAGFDADDIVAYSSTEEAEAMQALLGSAPGTAEFGHELPLMREYRALAEQGCGWLVVFAPDDAHAERVAAIAQRHGARLAERYHRLVIEDLL